MRFAKPLLVSMVVVPTSLIAQTPDRRTIPGNDVAVYNIAGVMRVEGGTGSDVAVEVTRGGADASKLTIQTGRVRGRETLRVVYPDRRIVYRQGEWYRGRSRTTLRVDDDTTRGPADAFDVGVLDRIDIGKTTSSSGALTGLVRRVAISAVP